MKNLRIFVVFSLFFIAFLSACGSDNAIDAGSETTGTPDLKVLEAGSTAVSEEFPPSPDCDPTSTTGVIKGSVQDPSLEFVIFGAGVTLTQEGMTPKNTSTDEEGRYRFCNVAPGDYQVSAYAVGFDKTNNSTEGNVEVKAGLISIVDLELGLGFQDIPSNIGVVKGSVIDLVSEDALAGVVVAALNNVTTDDGEAVGDVVKETTTDINGEFFLSLKIGTHFLKFSKDGFHSRALFVTISSDIVKTIPKNPVKLIPQ